MELVGTGRSHFTRKVRLLLDHLGLEYRLADAGDVSMANPGRFGDNPLMNVPVLRDGGVVVLDSDHIAAYLVRKYDPADSFDVLTTAPETLNARSILNGAMAAEVKLVLAERTGLKTEAALFFDKARAVIVNALDWCEAQAGLFDARSPTYLSFHLISFWDHVHFYRLVNGKWPMLEEIADALRERRLVSRSAIPG